MMRLHDAVVRAASLAPDALAVAGPDRALTYGALDILASQLGRALASMGVGVGDRVGLWLEKGALGVAVMQAVLRLGAAYVPVDPLSPVTRARTILEDCGVAAVVTTARRAADLGGTTPVLLADDDSAWAAVLAQPAGPLAPVTLSDDSLAYILYTSGSTGIPKGVCISHRAALAFAVWAAEEVALTAVDRLSCHAPFHFDLSVFDLYAPFLAGASVHLIPEGASYAARRLVEFAVERRLTVWYSVPSALMMMVEGGGLLTESGVALRAVLFAGEVYPPAALRALREGLPGARMLNLYGPTETNVCTWFELDAGWTDWSRPIPIGAASCGDEAWAVRDGGERAKIGEEGELWVAGPTVMLGYWGRAPQEGPYPTGDIVRVLDGGRFDYVGRRDHMVKVRGHRIELGEIEAALHAHAALREAAVVVSGEGLAARLVAFVVPREGRAPSLIALKAWCAARLPRYMIIDSVRSLDGLPRTGNGKVDRAALSRSLQP